jgi:hypothetical protein
VPRPAEGNRQLLVVRVIRTGELAPSPGWIGHLELLRRSAICARGDQLAVADEETDVSDSEREANLDGDSTVHRPELTEATGDDASYNDHKANPTTDVELAAE